MKIIVDIRENDLYDKCYSILHLEGNTLNIQLLKDKLPIGDIEIKTDDDYGIAIIERKTIKDLFASIKDGRYKEQSYRIINSSGYEINKIYYLIEGIVSQLTDLEKKLYYSTLTSINYVKNIGIIKTASVKESAEYIIYMCNKIEKELKKGTITKKIFSVIQTPIVNPSENTIKNTTENTTENITENTTENITENTTENYSKYVNKEKNKNITKENIGQIMLCQIPFISYKTAIGIMNIYKNISNLIDVLKKDKTILDNLKIDGRKISKRCVKNIVCYLDI
jgi:ERCC4-type nuclease